jgi:GNAT superfamily N-acetyltransferase
VTPGIIIAEIGPDRVAETWPVMRQLRPHLSEAAYVAMVDRMRTTEGFRLAAALEDGAVRAVAGFRRLEMLYCGVILSVDDLVVDEAARSSGFGKRMLDWLKAEARATGCGQVHLDSRLIRADAHRFYHREGFETLGYHFVAHIPS